MAIISRLTHKQLPCIIMNLLRRNKEVGTMETAIHPRHALTTANLPIFLSRGFKGRSAVFADVIIKGIKDGGTYLAPPSQSSFCRPGSVGEG